MIKLGVTGAAGKMGRRIIELARQTKDFDLKLALEARGSPLIGKELGTIKISSTADGIFLVDVVIDFTQAQASIDILNYVLKYKRAYVLGTTGFSDEQIGKIQEAAKSVPIVFSPNMSIGVNLLFGLSAGVAKDLGMDYDIEIIEAHHKAKKDAPSGTAKKLAQGILEATGRKVPIHAIRAGDIIGDHTVVYAGNQERIEIKHQAHSRDVFAIGALKAAKWIANKPPGLYSMRDVLEVEK